jgi:hypothetical protein
MSQNATLYSIVQHYPSGEYYALRFINNADGTITGVCGPLSEDEQGGTSNEYDFDDQPEDAEWAMSIGTDLHPGEALVHIRDLT